MQKAGQSQVQGGGVRCHSGAEVSPTERLSPRLNLRRSTRSGAWNVMSLSEVRYKRTGHRDYHLPQLSAKLRRLVVSVAAHSEVKDTWERVGTPTTGPAVHRSILKERFWPSPTDWSL